LQDHINKLIDEAHLRASKHIEMQTAEAEKSLQKRLLEAERKWREVTAVSAVKTQAIVHRLRAIAADAERRIVEETKEERDRGRKLLSAARVALKAKKNVALGLSLLFGCCLHFSQLLILCIVLFAFSSASIWSESRQQQCRRASASDRARHSR
jgi:hypothetical protein